MSELRHWIILGENGDMGFSGRGWILQSEQA